MLITPQKIAPSQDAAAPHGGIGEIGESASGGSFEAELVRAIRTAEDPHMRVGGVAAETFADAPVLETSGQIVLGDNIEYDDPPSVTGGHGEQVAKESDTPSTQSPQGDAISPPITQPPQPIMNGVLGGHDAPAAPDLDVRQDWSHEAKGRREELSTSTPYHDRLGATRADIKERVHSRDGGLSGGLTGTNAGSEKTEAAMLPAPRGFLSEAGGLENSKDVEATLKIGEPMGRNSVVAHPSESSIQLTWPPAVAPVVNGGPPDLPVSTDSVLLSAPVGGSPRGSPLVVGRAAGPRMLSSGEGGNLLVAVPVSIPTQGARIPGAQAPELDESNVSGAKMPLPEQKMPSGNHASSAVSLVEETEIGPAARDHKAVISPVVGWLTRDDQNVSGGRKGEEKPVSKPTWLAGSIVSDGEAGPDPAKMSRHSFLADVPSISGEDAQHQARGIRQQITGPQPVTASPAIVLNAPSPQTGPPVVGVMATPIDDTAIRKTGRDIELAGLPAEPHITRLGDRPTPLHATGIPTPPPRAVEQIALAAGTATDGSVEIRLDPEELGRVKLRLHGQEGAMSVTVIAERAETLDLLRRHIDQLAAQLKDIGYSELSFEFAGQGRGSGEHNEETLAHRIEAVSEAGTPERTPKAEPKMSATAGEYGMDLRV